MVFPYPYEGRGDNRSLQINYGTIGFWVIFYVFCRKQLKEPDTYTPLYYNISENGFRIGRFSEVNDFNNLVCEIP